MSIFDSFFSNRENKRVSELEKRVSDLEKALFEATVMLKQLAHLSLQTGQELENLAGYVKRKEGKPSTVITPKKTDDYFN